MGIVFEPPQPLSPSTSAAYGAASEYARLAPTIAGMAEAAGRQRLGAYGIAMGSFDRAMDRTFESDAFSKKLQFEADRSVLEAQNAINIQALRGYQQQIAQQQQAELEQWQKSQDITQKESLRLQHLQSGLGEIDQAEAAGVLTQQEAAEARFAIKTPIESLKAKQMMTEHRHMDAQTMRLREQTKRESVIAQEQAEFAAKTAQGRVSEVINPVVRKQVEMEFVAAGLGEHPAFEQLVENEARKRPGGVEHFLQTAPGKYERVFEPQDNKAKGREKPFSEMSATNDALAEAELAYPDDVVTNGKPSPSAEQLRKRNEYARKVFERKRAEAGGPPPTQEGGDEPNTERLKPPAAGYAPNPATGQAEPQRPFTPGDQSSMTQLQIQQVSKLSGVLQDVQGRPDLPPEKKGQLTEAIHGLHAMLAKYGTLVAPTISKEDRAKIEKYRRELETVPPKPKPRMPEANPLDPNALGVPYTGM